MLLEDLPVDPATFLRSTYSLLSDRSGTISSAVLQISHVGEVCLILRVVKKGHLGKTKQLESMTIPHL